MSYRLPISEVDFTIEASLSLHYPLWYPPMPAVLTHAIQLGRFHVGENLLVPATCPAG